MIKKEFIWINDYSMHARPAGTLVSKASKFESSITIKVGSGVANAKGLFSLMGIGIKKGDRMSVCIEGPDEKEADLVITEFLTDGLASKVSEA